MSTRPIRRAYNLVEVLLIFLALILIAAFLIPRYLNGRVTENKTAGGVQSEALDAVCRATLNQARDSVAVARTMHQGAEKAQSLADFHLPDSETHCIVGKEEYVYSPETGQLHCPHPGHESY